MDIAVFAKAPQAGAAKTRLIPALGAAGAARLQRRLTLKALRLANHFCTGRMALWCSPDTHHHFFRALHTRFGLKLYRQSGTHLGSRMSNAFAAHDGPLLLIGSDCPAMESGHLLAAAAALSDGRDAVFIPAEDGGYVLVGLQRPQPRLFEDIDWGSESVMAQTRQRLNELGLRWAEPATLWDVDHPSDLARLATLEGFGDFA